MMRVDIGPFLPRRIRGWLRLILPVFALGLAKATAQETAKRFNLASDSAEVSLKRFSEQSGRGVLFVAERVKGWRTAGVTGEWTPSEALKRMLSGTPLVAEVDSKTGAFAVRYEAPAPEPKKTVPSPPKSETSDAKRRAPLNPPNLPLRDEVVELGPFHVNTSRDFGYLAENSLAGTRLNTPLRDTASSVSVFTREFLDDAAITDVSELVRYSVNSEMNTNENQPGSSVLPVQNASRLVPEVLVRGFVANLGLDFFVSITPTDPYRVSRYEDSRGPNSILFGVGSPGGLLNQTSKVATIGRDAGAVRYSVGSWGRHRLELEANKVLREGRLAVAFAAVHHEYASWRAFDFQDKKRVFGSVTFRPTRKLSFSAMGETGRDVTAVIRPTVDTDGALAWYDNRQAFGVNAVTFVPNNAGPSPEQVALGITAQNGSRGNNLHRATFIENSGTMFDAIGTFLTGSYNNAAVRAPDGSHGLTSTALRLNDPAIYPRYLNAAGPGMFREQRLKNYTLTADWQATPSLAFNLAHNYQDTTAVVYFMIGNDPEFRGDANRTLGISGPPNPWAGRLYFDGNWRRDVHHSDIRETRISASYALDTNSRWFGRHRLGTLLSQSTQFDVRANSWLALAGHPFQALPSGSNNRIAVRNYITEGNYGTYRVGDWRALPSSVAFEGNSYGLVFANDPRDAANNAGAYQELQSALAVIQSHFAERKLVTTFGYRHDKIDVVTLGYDVDPLIGDVVNRARGGGQSLRASAQTGTAGVVYHIFDGLSLIANHSSNQGVPGLVSRVFPHGAPSSSRGRGDDYGVGFDLLEGRLNAKVTRFASSAEGTPTSSGFGDAAARNTRVMDAFTEVLVGADRPLSATQWEPIYRAYTPLATVTTFDYEASGYEARVTANLTRQWRLMANYSYTNSGRKNVGRELIAWYGLKTDGSGTLLSGVTQEASGHFVVDPNAFERGGAVAKWIELGALTPAANPSSLTTMNGQTVAQEILTLVDSLNEAKEEGEKRWGLRPHKISLFTAYDLTTGCLAGFTVGGGWRWRSANVIGTDSRGGEITGKAIQAADLMLAYRRKLNRLPGELRFQINIINLFARTEIIPVRYATSSVAPEGFVVPGGRGPAFARYDLMAPREIRFTTTYSF